MSELELFFLTKLEHFGPCKILEKKSKTSHLDCSGHIEGDIMQNHEQRKSEKKWKTKIYEQNKLLSKHPAL